MTTAVTFAYLRAKSGNDLQNALDDCNKSLALRPGDPDTLDSRALVEYRMGNFSASVADCDAALTKEPGLASSLYVRGLAKLKIGDAANGNADIAAANKIEPTVAGQFDSASADKLKQGTVTVAPPPPCSFFGAGACDTSGARN